MRRTRSVLSILALACVAATNPSANIKEIHVESHWQGWGSKHSDLLIRRHGQSFRADGRELSSAAVSRLMITLSAPPIAVPDAINLGFTKEWLAKNSDPGRDGFAGTLYVQGTPSQKALYLSTFQNPEVVQKLAPLICQDRGTDDDPRVEVDIFFEDGHKIAAYSQTQGAFLLPWVVERGSRQTTTYNADISRALAELLPDQFTNRSRLAGEPVKELLSEPVMSSIGDRWDLLGVEAKAPDAFARLQARFFLKTARIESYNNTFRAALGSSHWPRNFAIAPVLPVQGNQVEGVDRLLRDGPVYARRALAVPWLANYLAKNQRVDAEIEFTDDGSFSRKDFQKFAADMKRRQE